MPTSKDAWGVTGTTESGVLKLTKIEMAINGEKPKGIEMVGAKVLKDSKDNLRRMVYDQPERGYTRSGNLRRSGRMEMLDNDTVKVSFGGRGTNVDYAQYVEFGTDRGLEPRPYLKSAIIKNKEYIKTLGDFKKNLLIQINRV